MSGKEFTTPAAVSLIGLGALGILYAHRLARKPEVCTLTCIADRERQARYGQEGIFCNGTPCHFTLAAPEDPQPRPADLLIVAVKGTTLDSAIKDCRQHVGPGTVIISLLNGITSEEHLARAYPEARVLHCIAQGMDALRTRHSLVCGHPGELILGTDREALQPDVARVLALLQACDIPCREDKDIIHRLYAKWMFNVGINQVVAVFEGTYGTIQVEGRARDLFIAAMREAIAVANACGIALSEQDLQEYIALAGTLAPESMPSMRQDALAHRKTEVELFAGTVLAKARELGLETPINAWLYERLRALENA